MGWVSISNIQIFYSLLIVSIVFDAKCVNERYFVRIFNANTIHNCRQLKLRGLRILGVYQIK